MYPDVDPAAHVYAPPGTDMEQHLKRVEGFNLRTNDPTRWEQHVYSGNDYLQRMLAERAGNVVVISGNNARKTEYILASVQAGLNVLADKPLAITPADMPKLRQAFELAAAKGVLLYDVMTERFEITTILQRELSQQADLFGELEIGSPNDPAITKESVHHFSKIVAGTPLRRPAWFFDVSQQGEGIVDVTTHLVDLIQWEAFPGEIVRENEVTLLSARRWATHLTPAQFQNVTGVSREKDMEVFSNGEFTYRIRGVHAKVSVIWNYEAPPGTGDTHYSVMRGNRARLVIRQGAAEKYKPVLYIENAGIRTSGELEQSLRTAIGKIEPKYPGISVSRSGDHWRIDVPARYDVGHEAHFSQVAEQYFKFLREKRLPEWEVPNMLTKYATIMKAYEMSR